MKRAIGLLVFFLVLSTFCHAQNYWTGDGGRGTVIAVPAPVMRNTTADDGWIPQLFQDLITGDLARFSAMTVIDRSNEQMVLAEQNLSVSGGYSKDDYIRLGNLTNARYLVAGSVQNISGRYNVSFRINNTETNEIRATFNKAYSLANIETGLAAKEAVKELLAGMGVTLTEAGERALLAVQAVEVKATARLAQGMAAAKSDNIIEALAFLSDALDSTATRAEANRNIQSFFTAVPTGSIRERANFAIEQKAKWEKIFAELQMYVRRNLPVFIYDFSVVEDKIDIKSNSVTLTIRPGIKAVPDRNVRLVYKTVVDNWRQIRGQPENQDWARNVDIPIFASASHLSSYQYQCSVGLYDDYGDRVAYTFSYVSCAVRDDFRFDSESQVKAQQKYYDDSRFEEIRFTVPLDKVTDTMTPKIDRIVIRDRNEELEYPTMTVAEWQEWLRSQGNAR